METGEHALPFFRKIFPDSYCFLHAINMIYPLFPFEADNFCTSAKGFAGMQRN